MSHCRVTATTASRVMMAVAASTVIILSAVVVSDAQQLTGGCAQNPFQSALNGDFESFTFGASGKIGHAGTCQSYNDVGADFSVCRVFTVYDCLGSDGKLKMSLPNDDIGGNVNNCYGRGSTPYAMCVTRDRSACSINDLESQLNTAVSTSLPFQFTLGVNGTCFDLPKLRNEFQCDMTRSKTRVVVKCEEDQHASFWDDSNAVIVFWVIIGWCTLSVLGTSASLLSSARKWYQEYTALHNPRDTTFEDAPLLDVQNPRRENDEEDNKKEKKGGVQQTLWSFLSAFDALQNYRELIDTTERKVPKDPKTGAVKEDHDAETNWFDGIRCFALVAVIFCHWLLVTNSGQSTGFTISIYNFMKTYESFAAYPVFLSVDAFFYMSAFLFMHLRIRGDKRAAAALLKNKDENGYLARHVDINSEEDSESVWNTVKPYLQSVKATMLVIMHRYLRMTPAIMLVIFTAAYLTPYLPQGVLCSVIRNSEMFSQCKKDWWLQLLFITNLKYVWTTCCVWLWYLSADFQFFIIAVFLAPLYKANRFMYMGVTIAVAFASLVLFGQYEVYDLSKKYYYISYTRAVPYFLGLLMAALMNEPTIRRKVVPSFIFQVIGNLVAFGSFIASVNIMAYNARLAFKNELPNESLNRTISGSIEALFCTFLCTTTLLWGSGYGGITFRFFSHAAFRVPSKLTFSAYIIHLVIIFIIFGSRSYIIEHVDPLSYYSSFFGCVFYVMVSAVFVHVLLEAPIGKLNALLTRGGKKRK